MDTIIIFLLDHLFFIALLGGLAFVIYRRFSADNGRPNFSVNQEVMGQNYKTKNGDYVRCRITRVMTVWVSDTDFYHVYECKVTDANIVLELRQDRIKSL